MVDPNPYPGLRPYEREQYEFFFGRDRQIDDLLIRLRDYRFVAVVGLSGSGKSSLVRAGLIHKLDVGHLASARSPWRVALFRPGSQPIEALASGLSEALDPDQDCTAARLRESTQALLRYARTGRRPDENLLVVVDQFEEIFRFQREKDLSLRDAAHFVDLLLAVEQDLSPDYRIYVVLTMRSDSLGESAQFEGLPEVLTRCQYLVPRLTRDQLREAIEGPAALTETKIAPDLLQRLLSEDGQNQDYLPLLQHLLMQLWEKRQPAEDGGWEITSREFEVLKGPAEALNSNADQVLEKLTPQTQQGLARRMFQQLTEIREGRELRRPTRLSRLADLTGARVEEVKSVADHFYAASLLTSPDRGRVDDWEVDITHECLIRQWTRLRDWAGAEASDRDEFQEFAKRARRPGGELLTGTDLDRAVQWAGQGHSAAWAERWGADLGDTTRFIERSRAASEKAASKRRHARLVLSLLAGAAAVVVAIAGWKFVEARNSASELRRARLFTLVDYSAADPLTKALVLATLGSEMEADRLEPYQRLFQDVAATAIPMAVLGSQRPDRTLKGIDIGTDGRIVTVGADGAQRSWSVDGRGSPQELVAGEKEELQAVAFSGDHNWVAIARPDGQIHWGRIGGAPKVFQIPRAGELPSGPSATALSRTGNRLAVAYSVGSSAYCASIWQRRENEMVFERCLTHRDPISSLDFDAAENRLATASLDGVIRVWALATHASIVLGPIPATGRSPAPNSVKFSPDGRWLASGYTDDVARIWRSDRSDSPLVLQGHADDVVSASFAAQSGTWSGSNLTVGTISKDRTARLWKLRIEDGETLAAPEAPTPLMGHGDAIEAIAFSPDGSRVATASKDGTARVWWTENQEPRTLGRHEGAVESVSFSKDGKRLVTASRDKMARVWTIDGSTGPLTLAGHTDWVRSAAFSPADDSLVATASEDKQLTLWNLATRASRSFDIGMRPLALVFSPDGTRLAAASAERQAAIWRLSNSMLQAGPVTLPHDEWVFDIDFSPSGTHVVTASGDGTAKLWNITGTPALEQTFKVLTQVADDRRVRRAVFSPTGTRIATASASAVRLWRVTGPEEPGVIRHIGAINDVAFRPSDERWILTASDDQTARVSDPQRALAPVTLRSRTRVQSAAFDPTGRYVVTGGEDGSVRLWRLDPTGLTSYLKAATTACLPTSDRVTFLGEAETQAREAYETCEREHGREPAR